MSGYRPLPPLVASCSPISYSKSPPQCGSSAPPTTKMLIGNPGHRQLTEKRDRGNVSNGFEIQSR